MKKLLLCSALGSVFTVFVATPVLADNADLTSSQMMERVMKTQPSVPLNEEAQVVEGIQKNDPASAAMVKRKMMLEARAEEAAKAKIAAALADENTEKTAITKLKVASEGGPAEVSEVNETKKSELEITETENGVVITEITTETVEIEMPDNVENIAQDAVSAKDVDVVVAVEPAAGGADWGYYGANGAAYWGALDEAYATCTDGAQQSPVNIAAYLEEDLSELAMAYQESPLSVVNNGKTLSVGFASGGTLTSDGVEYVLDHVSFHTPSEHYLDGAPYPMEAHLVHKAADGRMANVAVMIKLGAHNPVIEGIWQNAPIQTGGSKTVDGVMVSGANFMPESTDYYKYDGSLTTPPCTEGVVWHVMKEPIEVSEKQLQAFQALFPVNARPVQPLNDRVILGN